MLLDPMEQVNSKDGKLVLERTTEGTVIKKDQQQENKDEWARVKIPFDSFRLVRGPRLVPDSPPINITGGVGMSRLGMKQTGER